MWLIQVADPQPAARRICSHSGHLLPRAALLQSCTQGCHQMYAFSCNFSCKQETAAVSHHLSFSQHAHSQRQGNAQKGVGVPTTPTTHSLLLGCCKGLSKEGMLSALLTASCRAGCRLKTLHLVSSGKTRLR